MCLCCAWRAGDSRAVLCRGGKAIQLTDDHKPEREDEAVSSGWLGLCGPRVQGQGPTTFNKSGLT